MSDRDRFNKYTERARKVLSLAQQEAQRMQHNYIGTEHLLLGLVYEGQGVAAKVLWRLGVDLTKVRTAFEKKVACGEQAVLGEVPLTAHATSTIELAAEEAQRFNHHYIGTEHLLLGLARVSESMAAQLLESMDVSLTKLRAATVKILAQSPGSQAIETGTAAPARSASPKSSGDRDRFGKFTVRARKVLQLAQEEALRFQHNYIGTEHLLLGLVREGQGVAAKVLQRMNVELDQVRVAVETIIGRGDRIVLGDIGLTPRAKKIIEIAVDEARRLNHHYIGTEHLLLGLIREGEGIGAGVLESFGLSLKNIRAATIRQLSSRTPDGPDIATERRSSTTTTLVFSDSTAVHSFTKLAYDALTLAREEARNFQHTHIGTEHLLAALLRAQDGLAAKVLAKLGISLEQLRAAIEHLIGAGSQAATDPLDLSPEAREAIMKATEKAELFKHSSTGTEHLLLGLLDNTTWRSVEILESLHVTPVQIYDETLRQLIRGGALVAYHDESHYDVAVVDDHLAGLTQPARGALHLARREAQRLQHKAYGTIHLLFGLLSLRQGVAHSVLQSLLIDLAELQIATEAVLEEETANESEERLTLHIQQAITFAEEESLKLQHDHIGSGHLLLGLLRIADSQAALLLQKRGITPEEIRTILAQRFPTSEIVAAEEISLKLDSSLDDYLESLDREAKQAIEQAHREALSFVHDYVGTEHLLLGLLVSEESDSARILHNVGVERTTVRRAVTFIIGRGDHMISSRIHLTPRSKKVIELAIDEAHRQKKPLASSVHLLLGLVREGEGIAAGVLESLGVNLQRIRTEAMRILEPD